MERNNYVFTSERRDVLACGEKIYIIASGEKNVLACEWIDVLASVKKNLLASQKMCLPLEGKTAR